MTSPVRRQVMTASIWVTTGLLAGRVAGIVREFLIADTFGVTRNADFAILLVTGPEILVTIAGSGAVGLVLIPILMEHEVGEQLGLLRRLTIQLGAVAVLLALVAAGLLVMFGGDWATGPGLETSTFRAAVFVTALAIPPAMVVVLTAAFLRAQDRFAIVSFSTVAFTIPILILVVTLRSVIGVAIGIALGSAFRYVMQVGLIRRRWRMTSVTEAPLRFRSTDIATSFGISVVLAAQVSVPLLLMAVLGGEGDVALLNYGWRVLLIPIALLGAIFSVAAYPSIVRIAQSGPATSRHDIAPIVRPVVLLSLIVAIWLWVNAGAAVGAVYRPAGLDEIELAGVASGIRAGAISVPLITIGTAATTVLFGLKQSRLGLLPYMLATPMLIVLGALFAVVDGPTGVMYAISVYAFVLGASATATLLRTSGFVILGVSDVPAIVGTIAGATALAVLIRRLLPNPEFGSAAVNGVVFVALCGMAYIAEDRLRGRSASDALK